MRSRGAAFAVALGLVLCGIGTGAAAPAPPAASHAVAIDGTRFQPDALTIRLGDSVVWTNKDPFPHTVTSKDGGFDSQAIQPGKSWKYKPAKRGDFAYACTFHPTMTAMLHVK